MSTPESKVKNDAKRVFKDKKIFYHMVVPTGYGRAGLPDFITCVPVTITQDMVGKTVGVFGGFEAKAPGKIKNTSANQKIMLREIHEAGGVALVFEDAQAVEEAIRLLQEYGFVKYSVP